MFKWTLNSLGYVPQQRGKGESSLQCRWVPKSGKVLVG